jgi:hypothetical protein
MLSLAPICPQRTPKLSFKRGDVGKRTRTPDLVDYHPGEGKDSLCPASSDLLRRRRESDAAQERASTSSSANPAQIVGFLSRRGAQSEHRATAMQQFRSALYRVAGDFGVRLCHRGARGSPEMYYSNAHVRLLGDRCGPRRHYLVAWQ